MYIDFWLILRVMGTLYWLIWYSVTPTEKGVWKTVCMIVFIICAISLLNELHIK